MTKKKKFLLVLLLTLLSGSIAGYGVLEYLQDRPLPAMAAEQNRPGSQSVVVAARELAVGSVVREEDVRIVDWPDDAVPTGYARSASEVLGRGVITDIQPNEALLASKLADPAAGGGLPIVVPPGMRAVSVKVDEVIGVAGFVVPGTRVDILLTMAPPGSNDPLSRIILENVRTLAAGQEIQRDEEGEPMTVTVITVLVSPDDAERLVLAATQGRIQMALRNTLDIETSEEGTSGIRISSLLAGPRPDGPRVPQVRRSRSSQRPSESIIEMYHGGSRTLITY